MALRTRLTPIDVTLMFKTGGILSPEMISRAIADYSREAFLEVDRRNAEIYGRPLHSEVYVDGAKGADIYRVRPDGVIVYEWDLANDIVVWCFEQIQKFSPVLTGRYREAHRVYADGEEVEDLTTPMSADEWVITSLVPYARKLEGAGGAKYMSSQAPDGVYQAVAALAGARYGNLAKIRFTYRQPIGPASMLEDWAQRHSMKVAGENKRRRQYLRDIRQPALIITFR